jgi:nucleoside 2-deoxyribosyltransferase
VKKKTFLICPVRGHDRNETEEVVKQLEREYEVHWPPRDTNQNDATGFRICCKNRDAIKSADVVHIIWDGKSQGSLFDLGMAFAFGKKIIPLELPEQTPYKSFQNMINEWTQK